MNNPAPSSRQSTIEKYGPIINLTWPNQSLYMTTFRLPTDLITRKDYNWVIPFLPNRPKVTSIYLNRDMQEPLASALQNILQRNLVSQLREFGGCFNIRASRGSNSLSAHAWGLALDINMPGNGLGEEPSMDFRLAYCFEDAGFCWGGRFKRPDGMHFSLAEFDKP